MKAPFPWLRLVFGAANASYLTSGTRARDGRGRENAARERLWFSPHCLKAPSLFSFAEEEVF
jgi:hypothetical protein